MADTLELKVVTPAREVLEETVNEVVAQGTLGQLGILPLHIPLVTSLEPGELFWDLAYGGSGRLAVRGGYLEVRDDRVTVLADEAVEPGSVDADAARARLEQAKERLEAAPFGDPGHDEARRELRWAEYLVEIANA